MTLNEQKAYIIRFKSSVYTPNETLKKLGYPPSQEYGSDMLLMPYGAPDGYAYCALQDRKTVVDISKIFPSQILKLIAC